MRNERSQEAFDVEFSIINTTWGAFGMVARAGRLVATFLPMPEANLRKLIGEQFPEAQEAKRLLPDFRKQVTDYFDGKRVRFSVPVDLADVPPFRAEVLKACRKIPYGATASYGDLAGAAGNPSAVRAAGGAMAHNPLPLVIPCHRVLRSDGSIGGFSSTEGVRQKRRLLALEGAPLPTG